MSTFIGVPICYNPCDSMASCNPDHCTQCDPYNLHTIKEVMRIGEFYVLFDKLLLR